MKKQKPKPRNVERNKRRNERKSEAITFAQSRRKLLACKVCGVSKPLVFYGQHRNLKIKAILDGKKSVKIMKRRLQDTDILCLNHAELRRYEN